MFGPFFIDVVMVNFYCLSLKQMVVWRINPFCRRQSEILFHSSSNPAATWHETQISSLCTRKCSHESNEQIYLLNSSLLNEIRFFGIIVLKSS